MRAPDGNQPGEGLLDKEILSAIDLSGRTACVTGAASGIGRATARRLAQAGAGLLLIDLNPAGLEETASLLEGIGGSVRLCSGDLCDVAFLERTVAEQGGTIDILVNNASILSPRPIFEVDEEEWKSVVDLDLKSYFFLSKLVAQALVRSGIEGSIVNVASQAYLIPNFGMATYVAAKGGVVAMTRAFARELGVHGIRVNAVSPGQVDTPGSAEIRRKMRALSKAPVSSEDVPVPARSVFNRKATASEIADAILFLSCNLSRYVTGAILPVDGGSALI
jgi:3-oxoacyl-[acyl-carrier protein] reductase